jgi:hypothetical protein
VHRHNRKYGHNQILAHYCGVDTSLPIMGEVQHSLFLSTHHFKSDGEIGPPRTFGAMGAPLFSWNSLLPIRNQIAIGDPLLYASPGIEALSSSVGDEDSTIPLVMPKLNEELNEEQRRKDYLRLSEIAREVSSSERVLLSVHPLDLGLAQKLAQVEEGIDVSQTVKSTPRTEEKKVLDAFSKLNTKRLIVSDYFGAHIFRANAYFGSKIYVDAEKALNRAIHPTLRPLLLEFLALATDDIQRQVISHQFMGTKLKREPSELKQLLYRQELPPLSRRIWVASYKTSRRAAVQIRKLKALSGTKMMGKKANGSLTKEFPTFNYAGRMSGE